MQNERGNSNRFEPPSSARNGRNHQHFIAFLKAVFLIAQKANIFLVDIEIDEAANLSVIAAQMLPQAPENGSQFR